MIEFTIITASATITIAKIVLTNRTACSPFGIAQAGHSRRWSFLADARLGLPVPEHGAGRSVARARELLLEDVPHLVACLWRSLQDDGEHEDASYKYDDPVAAN